MIVVVCVCALWVFCSYWGVLFYKRLLVILSSFISACITMTVVLDIRLVFVLDYTLINI